MISLWKAYHTKVVHLSALFLTLLFSLASLVSCNQPAPLYTSINLGIPAAALQSPVKGKLPDSTELHIGITFKIDPRLLNQADQQRPQPGQPSNPGGIGHGLGIDNGLFQKMKGFFQGIDLQLSKLRTYVSFQAKARTVARLLQTKFVIHQYKGRTFYAPATPPKAPTDFAKTIDAVSGLDNYCIHPKHPLHITSPQGSRISRNGALDCSPADQTLTLGDVAGAYGYNQLWQRG